MKPTTINGITVPQFETIDVFRDSDTDNVNEKVTAIHANIKIRDYFSNRVCVNCCNLKMPESDLRYPVCMKLGIDLGDINKESESFSCSAFEEKK